jgi:hypothetical protein
VPLAEELATFINEIITLGARPKPFELPSGYRLSPQLPARESYKHVVLVGHSTGAVLIRQVVADELRSLEESGVLAAWASDKTKYSLSPIARASLRLFAPAHRGVLAAGWLGVALTFPVLNLFFTIWLHSNPLYRSLAAGNPILEDLKAATERLHAKYPDIPALTASSIFGAQEAVVPIGGYQHEKVETVPGHSHTSVCKPSMHYSKPLEFVTDGLFGAAAAK